MITVEYGTFTAQQMNLVEELYLKGFGMDQAIAWVGRLAPAQVRHYFRVVGSTTLAQLEAELASLLESDAVSQTEFDFVDRHVPSIEVVPTVMAENHRRRSSDL